MFAPDLADENQGLKGQAAESLESAVLQALNSTGGGSGFNLTGPFAKFDQPDTNYVTGTTVDTASMVSNTAGWISSTAATR